MGAPLCGGGTRPGAPPNGVERSKSARVSVRSENGKTGTAAPTCGTAPGQLLHPGPRPAGYRRTATA